MTDAELGRFRTLLQALADEIERHLAGADAADHSITPDDAIGRLTRMEAIQAQAMSAEGRRRQAAPADRGGDLRAMRSLR